MSLEQPNKLTNLVSLQQQLTALLVHFHTIDTNRRCSCSATHRYKVSKNSCQGRDFPSGHPARLSRQQLGHGQCPRAGSQACNRHPAHQPGQRSKWSVCEIPKPPKPPKALPRGPRGGLCLCITLHKKVCHRHYYKTRAARSCRTLKKNVCHRYYHEARGSLPLQHLALLHLPGTPTIQGVVWGM